MDRYKRIIELGWSMEVLKNAKILVVGAGALGNEVLKNLALLGVGNILIIDMDKIENHNLTRSILFREADIGKYKSEVAAQMVRQIDPTVSIKPFIGFIQETLGMGVFREVDVVFGCLDNIQARLDVNKYCLQTNTVYIDAGLRGIDGDVKVFGPPYEVCFDCIMTDKLRNEAWRRFSCLKLKTRDDFTQTGPTSPTISSIVAGLQVQIGIKYLHNAAVPLNTRNSIFGNIDEFSQFELKRNDECPTHSLYETIPEVDIVNLDHPSDTLTIGELVEIVKKDLGKNATVELDYDLITHVSCKEHGIEKEIFKRRGNLFVDEVECPECKRQGKKGSSVLMGEYFLNQLDGSENFIDKTIAEIGAPLFHIFKAKAYENNRFQYKFYQISGDKNLIFNKK